MSWVQWTALAFVVVVLASILWDVLAYAFGGHAATFSTVLLATADQYRGFAIVVAFAVGVLFGHLFLPQRE